MGITAGGNFIGLCDQTFHINIMSTIFKVWHPRCVFGVFRFFRGGLLWGFDFDFLVSFCFCFCFSLAFCDFL